MWTCDCVRAEEEVALVVVEVSGDDCGASVAVSRKSRARADLPVRGAPASIMVYWGGAAEEEGETSIAGDEDDAGCADLADGERVGLSGTGRGRVRDVGMGSGGARRWGGGGMSGNG